MLGCVPTKLSFSQQAEDWNWPLGHSLQTPFLEHKKTFLFLMSTGFPVDPRKVLIVAGHHNWIVAAYAHFAVCYRYYIISNGLLFTLGGIF